MTEARFSVLSEFTCHIWFSGTDMKNEGQNLKQLKELTLLSMWEIRTETDESGIKDVKCL